MDFSSVTELAGQKATRVQMAMLRARYGWAAERAVDKDVLEVACGAGAGLKWLAGVAKSLEAGDLDPANCERARLAGSGVAVRTLDAHDLPFPDGSLDVVLLFEALYYLPCAARFFNEARRVLRPGGKLLMTMPNPEWGGFNASPGCSRYFSGRELRRALEARGFDTRIWAAFPEDGGLRSQATRAIRRRAARLKWIPRTMRGKTFLKRVFYGTLTAIPRSLEPERFDAGLLADAERARIGDWRVLYAEAVK